MYYTPELGAQTLTEIGAQVSKQIGYWKRGPIVPLETEEMTPFSFPTPLHRKEQPSSIENTSSFPILFERPRLFSFSNNLMRVSSFGSHAVILHYIIFVLDISCTMPQQMRVDEVTDNIFSI